MAIKFEVLGHPGRDNAAFVRIDTGQSIHRLLFDCGQGCLDAIAIAEAQQIEHLFFSHFHMDHVSGFDALFRLTYDRPQLPMRVYGPAGTITIMEHRMRGFLWNLHHGHPGEWIVNEISSDTVHSGSYFAAEAFSVRHKETNNVFRNIVYSSPGFEVEALILDHGTPSIGYVVREADRSNILMEPIAKLGLKPGSWMQQIKDPFAKGTVNLPSGGSITLEDVRSQCTVVTPGESFAYLTDFMLTPDTIGPIADRIRNVDMVVCESQYQDADLDLAVKNRHMTATRSAKLAEMAGAGSLMLFHISDRYTPEGRQLLLNEARTIFSNTDFPPSWTS